MAEKYVYMTYVFLYVHVLFKLKVRGKIYNLLNMPVVSM